MKTIRKRARSLLLALALALALAPTALADTGTTTTGTAYKDLDPRTEIYAVTQTPGSDYPQYGAKFEPDGGVYYGRCTMGGTLPGGRFGLANYDEMAGESAVSFYYSLDDGYSLEYWKYMYGAALEDGSRVFQVCINFPNEASDCASVTAGSYDGKLAEAFRFLNTLSCPVFIRIGAEVNVWDGRPAPEDYIAAYRHIAGLARTGAPNAALVFSVNYMSSNRVDMDSFYPGDQYVDWVGASLYYDRWHHSGDTARDGFYGVGQYGDALLNVQQTVNLSRLHKKPVIITENGSANVYKGQDNAAWAADRVERAYAFLPMVYPEIKCIISFDKNDAYLDVDYRMTGNSTVTSAYRKGVGSNPAYVSHYADKGAYYTKLSAYTGAWEGTMRLAAYTWSADKLSAVWSVDGQDKTTVRDYPYAFQLDAGALSSGEHTVKVTFSNGASKSYAFRTKAYSAVPTDDQLYVDGRLQNPTVYKIGDSNYFKLRDVAALLNGSEKQFAVGYDEALGAVQVTTGQPYVPNGTELAGRAGGGRDASASGDVIYIDGVKAEGLTVYQIDGSNYFKLRDLGRALDFYVGWDAATGVTISGGAGYQD